MPSVYRRWKNGSTRSYAVRTLPADAEGRLDVAELCRVKGRFAAAARFYREAFQAKPALADDLSLQHRLHAAIAAARAGTDPKPDKGNPPLDEAERARWRAQALDWLRAEKDACAKIIGRRGRRPAERQSATQRRRTKAPARPQDPRHPDPPPRPGLRARTRSPRQIAPG